MELLSRMESGCEWIILSAIVVFPLFLVVALVTLAGRKCLAPWFRHALWSLVLIRLVLPVSFGSPISLQRAWHWMTDSQDFGPADVYQLPAEYLAGRDVRPSPSAEPQPMTPMDAPVARSADSFPDAGVIDFAELFLGLALWSIVLGTLAQAVWTVVTSLRLAGRIKQGVIVADDPSLALLAEGCRLFGIRRPVTMSRIAGWGNPATVGVRRPEILLPEEALSWTEVELRHVVWHELAHISRFDAAWNVLLTIARCLHWWNPVFWWSARCWLAEREVACDALVVDRLGTDSAADYGRTLLKFVERMDGWRGSRFGAVLPGLVSLLGAKATFRRRLRTLAAPFHRESAWQRRLGYGTLLLLAVTGLTDAASDSNRVEPCRESAVTLPEDVVWRIGAPVHSGPTTCVSHDLAPAMERLKKDEPGLSDRLVAKLLQQQIALQVGEQVDFNRQLESIPDRLGTVSLIDGHRLAVEGTEAQHRDVREMLACWTEHGQRQISVEVCWFSTPGELTGLFPGRGGEVVSPEQGGAPRSLSVANPSVKLEEFYAVPAYVRMLTSSERLDRQQLAKTRGVEMIFAPKVTFFEGMTATVHTGQVRPFVTGLSSDSAGGYQPQILECHEGDEVHVAARYDQAGNRAILRVSYRHSEVVDVEVLKLKIGPKADEVAVQIPHLSGSHVELSMPIADGDTLMIAPLRRDREGRLRIGLITPRILDLQGTAGGVRLR